MGAIAKTALRFSFLKFKARSNSNDFEDKKDDEDIEQNTGHVLDIIVPNGHAHTEDQNKNFGNVLPNKHVANTLVIESEREDVPLRRENPIESSVSQRLSGVEERIANIESEMLIFKDSFDSQMGTVLSLLTEMKLSLCKGESETTVDTYSPDDASCSIISDTGTATTKF